MCDKRRVVGENDRVGLTAWGLSLFYLDDSEILAFASKCILHSSSLAGIEIEISGH